MFARKRRPHWGGAAHSAPPGAANPLKGGQSWCPGRWTGRLLLGRGVGAALSTSGRRRPLPLPARSVLGAVRLHVRVGLRRRLAGPLDLLAAARHRLEARTAGHLPVTAPREDAGSRARPDPAGLSSHRTRSLAQAETARRARTAAQAQPRLAAPQYPPCGGA